MFASEEELWGAVPDGNDDFVAIKEGVKGFMEDSGETKISYADLSARGHHDVGGFEISMEDPIGVKVSYAV